MQGLSIKKNVVRFDPLFLTEAKKAIKRGENGQMMKCFLISNNYIPVLMSICSLSVISSGKNGRCCLVSRNDNCFLISVTSFALSVIMIMAIFLISDNDNGTFPYQR